MALTRMKTAPIKSVAYAPRSGYALDVEVMPFHDLLRRAGPGRLGTPHRVDFHHMVWVTEGECQHSLDFESLRCCAGECLIVRAGDVHAFDVGRAWQAWVVAFRPEVLPGADYLKPAEGDDDIFQSLPSWVRLPPETWQACVACLEQMQRDAQRYGQRHQGNVLLRIGVLHLLARLHLLEAPPAALQRQLDPRVKARFRRFRALVERKLRDWHHVQDYARHLACSEKTLSQSVLSASGQTAKRYLLQRLVLEAKRQLIHTRHAVGTIGLELGFDEATNFIKFFKRETGETPRAFRQRYE